MRCAQIRQIERFRRILGNRDQVICTLCTPVAAYVAKPVIAGYARPDKARPDPRSLRAVPRRPAALLHQGWIPTVGARKGVKDGAGGSAGGMRG